MTASLPSSITHETSTAGTCPTVRACEDAAGPAEPPRRASPPLRRAATAGALSAVMPGLGQLANGEVNKAIWLFLGFAVLAGPVLALVALHLPDAWMVPALVASLLATLAVWLSAVVDAGRGAWHASAAAGAFSRPWQSSGLYALVFAIGNLLSLPLLMSGVREHLVEPFRIPSASMAPTVLPGDMLFADKRYNRPAGSLGALTGNGARGVQRGDIAIFANPNDRSMRYIKRIVGLPGDRVEVRAHDHAVLVNGRALSAPTPAGRPATTPAPSSESVDQRTWQVDWTGGAAADAALTVPPGHVFVLSDNRGGGIDSRQFGTVPLVDVVGRARQVWFSWGERGVRWDRLGLVLQ